MSDLGKSRHGIPDVVMIKIDKYVDSLAPQIQPRVAAEIEELQTKTVDKLEDMVVDAFRSLFDRGKSSLGSGGGDNRSLGDAPPDDYGVGSLPFANELVALTKSFSKVADDAGDDLRQIFDITEGRGGGGGGGDEQRSRGSGGGGDAFREGAMGFLSAAIDAVKEHRGGGSGGGGGQPISLDGLLGVLSATVKETSRDPEGKARAISPEIRDKVGAILRRQHAPLAEQFTRIALDHIKRWLRGNTSTRDLGDGVKGEITELVSGIAGMFGKKSSSSPSDDRSRGFGGSSRDGGADDDGGGHGFSAVISNKLSTGLAKVHRDVRLEFRNVLGGIEKSLFVALPDEVQGPLEKILGGNPFDPSLDSQAASRGGGGGGGSLGDELKAKLVRKIRDLVRKVQESLRQSVLTVVNGGHRRFERASWVFVQENVEAKVQRFLPDVRIRVPDDIGNEGVSVGAPQTPAVMRTDGGGGGGGNDDSRPPYSGQHSQPSYGGHAQQQQGGGQGQYGGGNPQWQEPARPGGAQDSYYPSQPPQQSYHQNQQSAPGYGYGHGGDQHQPSYNNQYPPPQDNYRPQDGNSSYYDRR